MVEPIYTETSYCRDCYKCVRACPVKAIQVKNSVATIVGDRCTFCGICTLVCPSGAKRIRNDVPRVQEIIKNKGNNKVFVSLSPSYISEFDKNKEALLVALLTLGFDYISETSIGDAIVSLAVRKKMEESGDGYSKISTSCPSVVELIKKYYPDLVNELSTIPSPLQCHAAYLRHICGDSIKVIYIGPCISKKLEADYTNGYPDISLTFKELREWIKRENIDLDEIEVRIQSGDIPLPSFYPKKAGISMLSVLSGGTVASLKGAVKQKPLSENSIFISGGEAIKEVFDTYESCGYLESLFCSLGCINGPGLKEKKSIAKRKMLTLQYVNKRLMDNDDIFIPPEDFTKKVMDEGYGILNTNIVGNKKSIWKKFSQEQIDEALKHLGKESVKDELNCGGCGYNTCRDMAEAYLAGMAEEEMCVSRMRQEAENKVNVLLKTIPMAVVIVNENLQIVDCNESFYNFFPMLKKTDADFSKINDKNDILLPSTKSFNFDEIIDLSQGFRDILSNEKTSLSLRIKFKNKIIQATLFEIRKNHLVGAIFDDITSPIAKREFVVNNAKDVIQHSLETVQQIASLLGENAAETEIMLNSLIDVFDSKNGDDTL